MFDFILLQEYSYAVMIKTIFHGSDKIVREPGFGAGSAYNDFGLGFYCCEDRSRAAEWAVSRGSNGFVSAYRIETEGLRVVNLCSSQYNALHWINVLLGFREFDTSAPPANRGREYINKWFSVDIQGCDCIIGWRADNSCFKFAQDFLSGRLSYQSLSRALTASDANRQFVLKSNRAFDRISFAGYETARADEYRPAARARELGALRNAATSLGKKDLFIGQMTEEEIKPYDTRLR